MSEYDPRKHLPPFSQLQDLYNTTDDQQFRLNAIDRDHDRVLDMLGIKEKVLAKWDEEKKSGILHYLEIEDPEDPNQINSDVALYIGAQVTVGYDIRDKAQEDGSEEEFFDEAIVVTKRYVDKEGKIQAVGRIYPISQEDDIEGITTWLDEEDAEMVSNLIVEKEEARTRVTPDNPGNIKRFIKIPNLDESLIGLEQLPKTDQSPSDTI